MTRACLCAAGVTWLAAGAAPSMAAATQRAGATGADGRPGCAWTAPATATTVEVRNVAELHRAVDSAGPNTTILVHPGEYRLERMLDLAAPGMVLRGAGRTGDVMLRGADMAERRVGVAVSLSAADVSVANLSIGHVGYHGIQVRGERGAARAVIHGVRIVDTGQQLVKGSTAGGPLYADEGLVACSTFEYTEHAPTSYTNGVDVLAGRNWVVRDNTFRRIRGPLAERHAAGPAILFWANSQDTRVERNTILESFRGIAFGLGPGASRVLARDGERTLDHQGGWIRSNVVINLEPWADEGIEANAAGTVAIDHNTVITMGKVAWSIGVRFPATAAVVRSNLTSRPILLRDGGRATLAGNVSGAEGAWLVDPVGGNASLAPAARGAIDAGVPVPDLPADALGNPRSMGGAPDAGAVELRYP